VVYQTKQATFSCATLYIDEQKPVSREDDCDGTQHSVVLFLWRLLAIFK